jgi:hypothetical protein
VAIAHGGRSRAATNGTSKIGVKGSTFSAKSAETPSTIDNTTGMESHTHRTHNLVARDRIRAIIIPPSAATAINPAKKEGTHE